METTCGLFGGKEVVSCIVLDACTGDMVEYEIKDIPEWVDIVFDGDYITKITNWNYQLSGGFWNSITSKKGCKQCTSDFGYITIGTDIWMYTGVTSMSGDSSNIGVIMANERTGEIKYYDIAGADEKSAMEAAEGEVQQFGYTASFPSMINVNGEPTYIMALTDANHIVKCYAMVNVENYSKVVVADEIEDVMKQYVSKMSLGTADLSNTDIATEETEITVESVQFIVVDGNTTVYIYAADGKIYKEAFSEKWIVAKAGDKVKVNIVEETINDDIILIK